MSDEKDLDSPFSQGAKLTPDAAEAHELELASDPGDLATRSLVFGYWFHRLFSIRYGQLEGDEDFARRKACEHALRCVSDHPGSEAARMTLSISHPNQEPELYLQLKAMWIARAEHRSVSPEMLSNAAYFFCFQEPERAEALFRRAIEQSPLETRWRREFAEHLLRRCTLVGIQFARRPAQRESLTKSLGEEARAVLEPLLTTSSGAEALDLHVSCAGAAIAAGDQEDAERHASFYVSPDCRPGGEEPSIHAMRRHHAHTILGAVAMGRGNLEEAERQLALSADALEHCRPHPNLPYLSLARTLVGAGRRQSVVEFLTRCAAKEFSQPGRIENWIAILNAGGTPEGEWQYS